MKLPFDNTGSIDMKKIYLLFITVLLYWFSANAQNCLSHEKFLQDLAETPGMQERVAQLEAETQAYIAQNKDRKSVMATKVIPIVFHVIHSGGSENISVAQIRNQVAILNAEFNRLFADTVKTPSAFKSLAGSFAVEFRLATKDPDGNCSQGVTRTYHPFTSCSPNEQDPKALIDWPSNKYLNVWLVTSMHYSGQTGCGGGGYAQFPGGNALTDGVNIRGDLIGSIGTATQNTGWGNFQGRYLIHELGHWFNLRHIWGDATCGDDLVSDTPPHQQSNSGCPSFPYHPNNTCNGGPSGEMFTDYMDYTNGPCLNMFSKGQVLRMEACLNSSAGGRSNLWTPANLAFTGTESATIPDCPATPEIFPYTAKIICETGTATFRDASYGGTKTSRLWDFPGGVPSSLTDSIVTVTYGIPGVYPVSLSVTNTNGTNTKSFADRVVVLDNSAPINTTIPYTEGFEDNSFNTGWTRINNNDDTTWSVVSTASFSGSRSMRLNNFKNVVGGIDEAISPRLDLSGLATASIKFKLSFARRKTSNKDKLTVFISKDCGATWTSAYSKSSNSTSATSELSTVTNIVTNTFTPFDDSEWREESLTIPASFRTNNVRLKFTFLCSGGNNLYIDDIALTGTPVVGVQDLFEKAKINLVPNPTEGSIAIAGIEQPTHLSILDLSGKLLIQKLINPGEQIETSGLKPGLYLWKTDNKAGKSVGKFVKL